MCEACKQYLDSGEEIPIHLLAKLLKFKLLDIKTRDVKRREVEKKVRNLNSWLPLKNILKAPSIYSSIHEFQRYLPDFY